jgi:hypothetical protein
MNYSGSTKFNYPIYRNTPDDTEAEIVLQVVGRSYFAQGRNAMDPDDSYPDEGDTEIISILGPDNKDWEDQLSMIEKTQIIEMITENVASGDDDYDPTDRDYHENDYRDDFGMWESDCDY